MNILVYGAGAIGSVFGGFLAKNAHHVILFGRKPHMSAIKNTGLIISGIWGDHHVNNLKTAETIDEIKEDFDLILLTVKSFDTSNAARHVSRFINKNTLLISLQNGINNYERITQHIPPEKIVMGRVIFGVEVKEPGHIYISVYAEEVRIGQPLQHVPYEYMKALAQTFTRAGIPTLASKEIMKYIWAKLLYNSALNPLSALLGVPYGALPLLPGIPNMMMSIIEEIFSVAKAHHQDLFCEKPEEYFQLLNEKLIPNTAAHFASMHYDLTHGKQTEIDAINGAVSKLGIQYRIPTPFNDMLTTLIKAKQNPPRL